MKTPLIIMLVCITAYSHSVTAQRNVAGLFLDAADFGNHVLSHKPAAGKRHIIRLNEVVYLPYVTVVDGAGKHRLAKAALFGYLTSDGKQFRFYKREAYEILSNGNGPVLYRQSFFTGGKSPQTTANYFFSKSPVSSIEPLTKSALAAVYSEDTDFAPRVYEAFSGDGDLVQYDSFNKVYKLAKVYAQSHSAKQ